MRETDAPYTLSRFRVPGRILIGSEVYEALDEALAEAIGLVAFADFAIETTITDSRGVEKYRKVTSAQKP